MRFLTQKLQVEKADLVVPGALAALVVAEVAEVTEAVAVAKVITSVLRLLAASTVKAA